MASNKPVKIDRAGIGRLLKSDDVAAMVNRTADRVHAAIDPEVDAKVAHYTTDRRAAAVRCKAEDQLRDGALTRAAAAVGLTVYQR